jgi:GH15 family glucan-1,4-alpha-glucosidase
MYKYGLIGNCQVSALISEAGSIDWLCMPRPDSPPIFGKLLDPDGGHFSIEPTEEYTSKQEYMTNTNVLVTTITTKSGAEFRIKDFAPRFMQYNRQYRPLAVFRIIEPVKGASTIQVRVNPVSGWDKKVVKPVRGNSHLRYHIGNDVMRLITNMPLTYLYETIPFSLTETIYFGLTWSFGIEDDLIDITNDFYRKTVSYWRKWVQRCSIPSLYQKETIRSALALKLHCYEDTGAILASISTSLPEEKGQKGTGITGSVGSETHTLLCLPFTILDISQR